MKKITLLCAFGVLLLAGCADAKNDGADSISSQSQTDLQQVTPTYVNISQPVQQPVTQGDNQAITNIKQCRNELDALGAYSQKSYASFQSEFTRLGKQTAKYLQIKDQVSPDINELVFPRQVFKMRELCFRIKTRLSQVLIQQAAQ